jgi:hypothetical protein
MGNQVRMTSLERSAFLDRKNGAPTGPLHKQSLVRRAYSSRKDKSKIRFINYRAGDRDRTALEDASLLRAGLLGDWPQLGVPGSGQFWYVAGTG